jgi:transcriptional repressor NrdR
MKCLFCQNTNTEVIETRVSEDKTTIRRRRSCGSCKKRFTTYERVEELPILVVKRDERRERFDRKKLLSGVFKAVGKTTVTADQVEVIVSGIEQAIIKWESKSVAGLLEIWSQDS